MLILTRKLNQKLIINDEIEVVVLETYKNAVKIGIKAPSNVQVFREEIWREIKKANEMSHSADVSVLNDISAKGPKDGAKSFNLLDTIKQKH